MAATVLPYRGFRPQFGDEVFLASTAAVIGRVKLGARASVWYSAVVRGDVHSIEIGEETNVQDGAVLHGTLDEFPVSVGARVSIGHNATVHGATIEDDCLIGIGASVLDGARIGAGSLVAAGALVREGVEIPPRSLVVGVPGIVKRELTDAEVELVKRTPPRYRKLALEARAAYLAAGEPDPFPGSS